MQSVVHTGCHAECRTYRVSCRVSYIQGVMQSVVHTGCHVECRYRVRGSSYRGWVSYIQGVMQSVVHTGCHAECRTYRVSCRVSYIQGVM